MIPLYSRVVVLALLDGGPREVLALAKMEHLRRAPSPAESDEESNELPGLAIECPALTGLLVEEASVLAKAASRLDDAAAELSADLFDSEDAFAERGGWGAAATEFGQAVLPTLGVVAFFAVEAAVGLDAAARLAESELAMVLEEPLRGVVVIGGAICFSLGAVGFTRITAEVLRAFRAERTWWAGVPAAGLGLAYLPVTFLAACVRSAPAFDAYTEGMDSLAFLLTSIGFFWVIIAGGSIAIEECGQQAMARLAAGWAVLTLGLRAWSQGRQMRARVAERTALRPERMAITARFDDADAAQREARRRREAWERDEAFIHADLAQRALTVYRVVRVGADFVRSMPRRLHALTLGLVSFPFRLSSDVARACAEPVLATLAWLRARLRDVSRGGAAPMLAAMLLGATAGTTACGAETVGRPPPRASILVLVDNSTSRAGSGEVTDIHADIEAAIQDGRVRGGLRSGSTITVQSVSDEVASPVGYTAIAPRWRGRRHERDLYLRGVFADLRKREFGQGNGSVLLPALGRSGTLLGDQGGSAYLYFLSDGRFESTAGGLRWSLRRVLAEPTVLVDVLADEGLVPDLTGVTVITCGLWSEPRVSAQLRAFYTLLFRRGGAHAVRFSDRCDASSLSGPLVILNPE